MILIGPTYKDGNSGHNRNIITKLYILTVLCRVLYTLLYVQAAWCSSFVAGRCVAAVVVVVVMVVVVVLVATAGTVTKTKYVNK